MRMVTSPWSFSGMLTRSARRRRRSPRDSTRSSREDCCSPPGSGLAPPAARSGLGSSQRGTGCGGRRAPGSAVTLPGSSQGLADQPLAGRLRGGQAAGLGAQGQVPGHQAEIAGLEAREVVQGPPGQPLVAQQPGLDRVGRVATPGPADMPG